MEDVQTIQFCQFCENKLYHQVDNDSLVYFCYVCGEKEETTQTQGICVLNIDYGDSTDRVKPTEHIINKYTKYDPTLPHIQLPCPNEKCTSYKGKAEGEHGNITSDVIYLRYDNAQMKHLYMCAQCDFTWKTNDK
jgi:DNA-directed RNA polymerase subunit M/transcription elongation factor TFIIS